jgi:hypothetical protein
MVDEYERAYETVISRTERPASAVAVAMARALF